MSVKRAVGWPESMHRARAYRSLTAASGLILAYFGGVGCHRPSPPAETTPARHTRAGAPRAVEIEVPLSGAEQCFNALDDNRNSLIDEGCGVHQGQVQFAVAWAEPEADVDLYVSDPSGQIAPADGVTELGLAKSVDCPGDKAACSGQNFENVYLEGDLAPGLYRVRVRVERLPERVWELPVGLGVRLPGITRSFDLRFSKEEQEINLEFSVAGKKRKE